ncbi:MAG: glycosyltransferase family 39 protein [Proteobacteria bacterium]|nr:glycosyltransferase family 39 protein [Pseudomonadota bacterium]
MSADFSNERPRAATRLRARAQRLLATRDRYDVAVAALFVTLTVLVLATFHVYAITNDEPVQQRYGELIVAYYASAFKDQALFHFVNLYLYGGLFDGIAVLIQRALPMIDPYAIRHLLCAFIGLGGIGAAWATARMVAGPRAAAIAAFALAVCGPWYGSMFNHTKDIPFAAAMMGATYFLLRAVRDLPRPRWHDVAGFGLLLGAALGIRVLGLLMVGYVALAIFVHGPAWRANAGKAIEYASRSVTAMLPAFVIAYLIMIVAWPWSALSPLNPIRGLVDFGQFHYQIRTLLGGHIYEMANVPRWYVPAYLLFKLPLLIVAGAVVSVVFIIWPRRGAEAAASRRRNETLILAVIAAFPVLCEVIDRGPAFTGLRHFLFVVPVFAVLTGIGLDWLLTRCAAIRLWLARAAALAIVALLGWNTGTLIVLHPYEYLFFNPLVGGLPGAAGRYDGDYWVTIMPEAVDDLEAYVAKLDAKGHHTHRYKVAVCGERLPFEKEANSRLQWVSDWTKAEFFIAPTHMNCDRALGGREVSTIKRLGVKIGVVKDRRALLTPEVAGMP